MWMTLNQLRVVGKTHSSSASSVATENFQLKFRHEIFVCSTRCKFNNWTKCLLMISTCKHINISLSIENSSSVAFSWRKKLFYTFVYEMHMRCVITSVIKSEKEFSRKRQTNCTVNFKRNSNRPRLVFFLGFYKLNFKNRWYFIVPQIKRVLILSHILQMESITSAQ